jgi:ribosome-binding factor A
LSNKNSTYIKKNIIKIISRKKLKNSVVTIKIKNKILYLLQQPIKDSEVNSLVIIKIKIKYYPYTKLAFQLFSKDSIVELVQSDT